MRYIKKGRGKHNMIPVVYDGNIYESLESLSRKMNTSPQRLRYYLKNDMPYNGHYLDYAITDCNF